MRILFIIQKLYNGGAEHVVARLASSLCLRHEVYLAFTDSDPFLKGKYETHPDVRFLDAGPVLLPPGFGPLTILVREESRRRKLHQIKKRFGIEVSISFLSRPNWLNVSSRHRDRTVISVRNMMSKAKYNTLPETVLRNLFDRVTARRADCMVTVSRQVAADQMRVFHAEEEKIRTIYNPVEWEKIREEAKKETGDGRFQRFREGHDFLLVTVGRLTEQKAQWQLIRAMRDILQSHPSAGLVIFGMGELREKLEKVIAENGLGEHVYLAGYQIEPYRFLGKADVFVMGSQYEGFSNAMLEAMACGLPVVSTDGLSGPRELLAPDTDCALHTEEIEYAPYGILTPPFSGNPGLLTEESEPAEKLFAEAVSELLSNPERRRHYREQSLLRVRDFSTEKIAAQWEALCEELLLRKEPERKTGGKQKGNT